MARNAGTTASGSTITKSELAASKMYSKSLIKNELNADDGESQSGLPLSR